MPASAGQGHSKRTESVSSPQVVHSAGEGRTYYVHLCSGDVIELPLVTSIEVTENEISVFSATQMVACFPRSNVYFVADMVMALPSLN
jgi:hypothetical protein